MGLALDKIFLPAVAAAGAGAVIYRIIISDKVKIKVPGGYEFVFEGINKK